MRVVVPSVDTRVYYTVRNSFLSSTNANPKCSVRGQEHQRVRPASRHRQSVSQRQARLVH